MSARADHTDHLYLHVPFCRTICSYCDFCHSVYQEHLADQWLSALTAELQKRQIHAPVSTIYIGGGTPTSLSLRQLDQLLSLLDGCAAGAAEYTIEVNPESLDEEKAACMAAHGVNRASIGLETSDPVMLKLMNRHHDAAGVGRAMTMLRQAGIHHLSLDLMYSLPGQTMAQLQDSVSCALALAPDHLSLYSLTIEPGTVFAIKGLRPCSEDLEADMYEWICRELPAHGLSQYEISNFCLPGCESRHNMAYWEYQDFYGISCGASGKEGHRRYDMTRSLKTYLTDPLSHQDIPLSTADEQFETVMMGLRLKRGFSEEAFRAHFGSTVREVYGPVIRRLMQQGLLQEAEGFLACTDRGFEILNTVLEEFLPDS